MGLLFVPENIFFAIAIALMIIMTCTEAVASFAGFSLSEMVESLIPEVDLEGENPVFRFLRWLRIDELPYFETGIIFLGCFGFSGFIIQMVLHLSIGFMFHPFLASFTMLFFCLPLMRVVIGIYSDKAPGDGSISDLVDELMDKFQ